MPVWRKKNKKNKIANNGFAANVRRNIIGHNVLINTPFGRRKLFYADFIASGRAYGPIEDKIKSRVLPLYANTHTESSATGRQSTAFREEARAIIAKSLNAGDEDAVLFCGSGCTGAVDKLIRILRLQLPDGLSRFGVKTKIKDKNRPVVFIGPYEHHSNDVQWRETIADVITIAETDEGLPCLEDLRAMLEKYKNRPVKIGSFSACSNVTGIITPVEPIARLLHEYGAMACFDFAASAPYQKIDINPKNGTAIDAAFISPHKFVGGPGTPGILVVKKKFVKNKTPVVPGGGTVSYVSPCAQAYLSDIEHREEGGTPDIIGAIRAGLAFDLQAAIGADKIFAHEIAMAEMAMRRWGGHKNIKILGSNTAKRLPIFSFLIKAGDKYLHYNFVVALLNDLFGIQARGGCSCAGPYGHRLLDIDLKTSAEYEKLIATGVEILKPGWVRVGFNYFFSDADREFLLKAVEWIADNGEKMLPYYSFNANTGIWKHVEIKNYQLQSLNDAAQNTIKQSAPDMNRVFALADSYLAKKPESCSGPDCCILDTTPKHLRWFCLPQ